MNKKEALRYSRRILWCVVLLLWAGVTVYTFGFHHHHPGERECEKDSCPFLGVVLNLPLLFVALFIPPIQLPRYETPAFTVILAPIHFFSLQPPRAPPLLPSR